MKEGEFKNDLLPFAKNEFDCCVGLGHNSGRCS